jgi:hypothetical protein
MRGAWAVIGALGMVASCAPSPTVASYETAEEFSLAVGESAAVSGTGLLVRFERVVSDSRCPSDAICITSGEAVLTVAVARDGRPAAPVSLRTERSADRATVGDWALSLTRLEPYPSSGRVILAGDYVATFRVDPLSLPAGP